MLAAKNKYIESAYEQLQVISQDKQKRLEYEAREKTIRDYNQMMFESRESGRQEGIEIGETQKSIAIAKNFIALGLPSDTISKGTGLTIEEIEKIRAEN